MANGNAGSQWIACGEGVPTILGKGSVGIDLKELGSQMSKCLKFCPGTEI